MRIFGKFADINGKMVTVDILTNGDYVATSGQDTQESLERKYLDVGGSTQESPYLKKAQAKADFMFPKFASAKDIKPGYRIIDNDNEQQIIDDGGGGGGHTIIEDKPTPNDNIDDQILPPIVPDTDPAPTENNNGSKTDYREGNAYYGENADYIIGEDGLWFAGNPFEITSEIEDNFEPIIKQTAMLRLVTSHYVGHLLFSSKMRKSRIIVKKEGVTEFDGYLTMNIYNQPFNTDADTFEVQCVDKLATINFFNYKKTFPETYNSNKSNSNVVTFKNVLLDALSGLDGNIWYDCSKSIDNSRWESVFDDIGIGENIFYGDDFDDMMTREDSLTQVLQYLNLHIIQHREDFYIFDWDSIKKGNTRWKCLTDSSKTDNYGGKAKILAGDMHMAMDTDINIADVYSQVQVTCDVEEAEEILADMFNKKDLKSWYNSPQKYMTEYISEGEGESAKGCMNDMIDGIANDYDGGSMVDWYLQAMYNPNWTVAPSFVKADPDQSMGGRYVNQHKMAKVVKDQTLRAGFFRIGKVERKPTELENVDPVASLDTKDYLYISVNGNEEREEDKISPSDSYIAAHSPIMTYSGNTATGAFSPVDYDTTNYLVFEGKIELQPNQKESMSVQIGLPIDIYTTVSSENNDDGRFYTRKWYEFFDCNQTVPTASGWTSPLSIGYARKKATGKTPTTILGSGLMVPAKDKSLGISLVDKHEDPFRYEFSDEGDRTDQIRKVPVLECSLRIGDKKLVEYDFQKDGSSKFGWFKDGEEPYITVNGKRTNDKATTFTLGFNPSIGDVILGKEYDIQNTVSFTMNIDAKGTAIPIKKEDALSGNIDFKILGPCTLIWNQVIRIHPSFWRHTSWEHDALPILAFIENIIISDFSVKVVSDNALDSNENEDNDLMYVAQETDYNFNTKHETDFSIITQLDSATAKAKGIKNGVYTNAAVNTVTNKPLENLYTRKEGKKKAEEHYVYDYLEDWRKSRITLSMTLRDDDIDFRDRFGSVPLKKSFNILGISKNIKLNTATLTMREYADGLKDFEDSNVRAFKDSITA